MLKGGAEEMALDQDNRSVCRVARLANSDSCVVTDVRQAAKRHLNGSTVELEPVIKQEKLDSGYDQAEQSRIGTLLGTIMPSHPVNLPHPVTMLTSSAASSLQNIQSNTGRGQPRKSGNARSNRTRNFGITNGRNNRMLNRPVVLLPHGGVALPRPGPMPVFIPPQRLDSPPIGLRLPTRDLTTVSTNASVVVLVTQPSASRARVVYTTVPSTATSAFTRTTVHLPSASQANGMRIRSTPLDQLKAIIGKSALENYVGPHKPPSDLHMPARCKHTCQGCGDEFVTSVGLIDHVSRRSLVISFYCTCNVSTWPQRFYNPCIFESFYRLHCIRSGVHASRDSVIISALELDTPEYRSCLEVRNRQKRASASKSEVSRSLENTNNREPVTTVATSNSGDQHVPAAVPVKEIFVNLEVMPNKDEQVEPSENAAWHTAAAVVKKHNRNGVVKPVKAGLLVRKGQNKPVLVDCLLSAKVVDFFNALWHNGTKCQECGVEYKTRRWLSPHFAGLNRTIKQWVKCDKCELSLPTICSLRAHQRLHENRPPFVCPRCGIVFDKAESADAFRAHVERRCFHFMRTTSGPAVSSCPRCTFSIPDADVEKMAQHFVDAHATVYYKCRSCPKAFSNTAMAKRHFENTGHEAQKDIVRKCSICDGVFKERTGTEMRSHAIEHLGAPKFQCPVCPERSDLLSVIDQHMHSCHPEQILPINTCEVCSQPCASCEELFTHVSVKHVDYFESVMKCLPSVVDKTSTYSAVGESGSTTDSAEETVMISESEVRSNTSSVEPSNTTSVTSPELVSISESEVRSVTPSKEVLECTRCQMTFDSEDVYKRHRARHRFLELKKARKKLHAAGKCSSDPLQQVPCFPPACLKFIMKSWIQNKDKKIIDLKSRPLRII